MHRSPPTTATRLTRLRRRPDAFKVPQAVEGRPGQYLVDATWGTITPMALAPGVETIGELEVISHIEAGRPLIDTRLPHYLIDGTIPNAVNIPHTETIDRLDEFDKNVPTVLFCNGPQCAATPDAIGQLLAAGWPPDKLLFYRGGLHDWVTLGLPTVAPAQALRPTG